MHAATWRQKALVLTVGSRSAAQPLPAKRNKAETVGCPAAVQHDDDDDNTDKLHRGDFNCLSRHDMSGACDPKHENAALAVPLSCKQAL